MKNPKTLTELLNAQKAGEKITFDHDKTLVERAEDLLQDCLKDINENCYVPECGGHLIPQHTSQEMRLLQLLVDLAKDIQATSDPA